MANPLRLNKTKLSFPYTAQHQRPGLTLTHTAAPHPTQPSPSSSRSRTAHLIALPHPTEKKREPHGRHHSAGEQASRHRHSRPASRECANRSFRIRIRPARPPSVWLVLRRDLFLGGAQDSPRGGLRWRTFSIRRSARTTTTGEHQPPCATLFLFKFPVFLARFLCFSV
jgi:hypothetical protein